MTILKIKKLESAKDLPLIEYKTNGSAGLDLIATEDVILSGVNYVEGNYKERGKPGFEGTCFDTHIIIDQKLIPTGIQLEIPEGYYGQVCARSGLAMKNGIDVGISPGVIDCDFRGELRVLLRNYNCNSFEIKRGDRVAQLVMLKYERMEIQEVEELSSTERGEGGFGSTGVK